MKKIILTISVLIGMSLSAQTNIISLRSHAGSMNNISAETDNFGEMYRPRTIVDTVTFIKKGVVIESRHFTDDIYSNQKETFHQSTDTLYGQEYTKILTPSLKSRYSKNVIFIGFEEQNKSAAPFFKNIHQNGISLFAFLLFASVGMGSLLFRRTQKTKMW